MTLLGWAERSESQPYVASSLRRRVTAKRWDSLRSAHSTALRTPRPSLIVETDLIHGDSIGKIPKREDVPRY